MGGALRGEPGWLDAPVLPLAPVERPILAPRGGRLARVDTRQLGFLLIKAGAGRARPPLLSPRLNFGHSYCRHDTTERERPA
jgi:thymidine phosphorylase